MATDRAAVQAGCRRIAGGRRGDRQCARRGWGRGRVIHHAATRAIAALVVAMVETPLDAALMPTPRRAHRRSTRGLPTRDRAVHVAAITATTDGEGLRAARTGPKAKRVVHGAARRCCHWTPVPIRGTKKTTVLVPCSPRRSRGPGVAALGPHLVAAASAYLTRLPQTNAVPSSVRNVSLASRGAPRPLRGLGAVSGGIQTDTPPRRSPFRITRFRTLVDSV